MAVSPYHTPKRHGSPGKSSPKTPSSTFSTSPSKSSSGKKSPKRKSPRRSPTPSPVKHLVFKTPSPTRKSPGLKVFVDPQFREAYHLSGKKKGLSPRSKLPKHATGAGLVVFVDPGLRRSYFHEGAASPKRIGHRKGLRVQQTHRRHVHVNIGDVLGLPRTSHSGYMF